MIDLGAMTDFSAAVLVDTESVVVCGVEMPRLDDSQVAVEMLYSGICGSQLMEFLGHRGEDRFLPHLFGHEGVGIVTRVGKRVKKVEPGQRVALTWIKGEGLDSPSIVLQSELGLINAGQVSTLTEFAVVAESRVFPIDVGVSDRLAVLLGCALPTGVGMVLNSFDVGIHHRVGVFGLGGVGTSTLLTLKALGAKCLVVTDTNERKREWAHRVGVAEVIDPAAGPLRNQLEHAGIFEFDLVFDCSGSVRSMEAAFESLSRHGALVFASHPPTGQRISLDPHQLISGKSIKGSWGGDLVPELHSRLILETIEKVQYEVDSLLSKTYTLKEVGEALDDLRFGRVLRPLVSLKN